MKSKYTISLIIVGIGLIISLLVAESYALWQVNLVQTTANVYETGCFKIEYTEQTSSINLDNTYPVADSVGLGQVPYTFTVKNTCSISANYQVTLNTLTTNTMNDNAIKFAIYENNGTKPTTGINLGTHAATPTNINTETANLEIANLNKSIILATGQIAQNESKTYNLYLWINNASGNESQGTTFEGSLSVVTSAI